MFKSLKKVLVGVLASSLILSSVAFAADTTVKSPADAPKATVVNTKTVKKAPNKAVIKFGSKVTTVKANAVKAKTITFSSKKKATVAKNAFKSAKKLKTLTVYKNKVTFKKGAFGKLNTKKMTIKVKGLKKNSKAFKKYVKALRKAGFKGKVKAVK
jgi:hypothetical protein